MLGCVDLELPVMRPRYVIADPHAISERRLRYLILFTVRITHGFLLRFNLAFSIHSLHLILALFRQVHHIAITSFDDLVITIDFQEPSFPAGSLIIC
jgi:hypothetical protein